MNKIIHAINLPRLRNAEYVQLGADTLSIAKEASRETRELEPYIDSLNTALKSGKRGIHY